MSTIITKIGHASISETGSINGAAGDSTGNEVCMVENYNISRIQPYIVLRPKTTALANASIVACKAGCNNNHIGYSQNSRNTLNTYAKAAEYDLSKVLINCNTDCSAFMTVCAIAGGAKIDYGSNAPTTTTMRTRFKQSGYYTVLTDTKYTTQTDYLKPGDILVREGHHTIMVLENGSAIIDDDEEVVEPAVPEEPEDPTVPGGITTLVKITTRSVELSIDKIEDTKASINIKIVEQKTGSAAKAMSDSKVAKYTWNYQLENLSKNAVVVPKKLPITSGTYKLDLANLTRGTAYALQVFAVKSGKPAFCSPKLVFIINTAVIEKELEKQKFVGDPTNVIKQIYIKVDNTYQPAIIYKM
jgi:hypothetical protein